MTDKDRERIAVFRYGIISPLVVGNYIELSKDAFYKNASARITKDHDGNSYSISPSTIERWYSRYMKNGLDGLIPKKRIDKGRLRKLNDDVIADIEEIKSRFPRIQTTVIYDNLIKDGTINKKIFRFLP